MKKKILFAVLAGAVLALCGWLVYDGSRPVQTAASPAPSPFATAAPTVAPTPTPAPTTEEIAARLLAQMSDEEKVWQLLYVFPEDVCPGQTQTDPQVWRESLAACPVGGLVISTENMASETQLKAMLSAITQSADIVPFIGVDEEGGQVARLSLALGVTTDYKAMYTYKEQGTATAYANAFTIASDLASFGFNQDFAPVADVWTNSANTVIGKRAYSDDPEEAAELVSSAVRGFIDGGVIATLKHFPGHGDTSEDSHYSAAHSGKTAEELRACEFLPFSAGMDAGAGMVMVGHITMDAIDPDVPATLSYDVVTGLLREQLGWDGVVITDSYKMYAITGQFDECDAAVRAINAGCDIVLGAYDPRACAEAILQNVSAQRIDQSVLRILALKLRQGLVTP